MQVDLYELLHKIILLEKFFWYIEKKRSKSEEFPNIWDEKRLSFLMSLKPNINPHAERNDPIYKLGNY